MKNLILVTALAFSGQAFGGRSEKSTLENLYNAVRSEKVSKLKKELSGKALEEYGNVEGLMTLKNSLNGITRLKFVKGEVISSRENNRGQTVETVTAYTAVAQKSDGSAAPTHTLNVDCDYNWVLMPSPGCGPWRHCPPNWTAFKSCSVNNIERE